MNIDIIVHKEDNGYWTEVPALKGCYSQGDTIEELKENIKEAIYGWFSIDEDLTDGERVSLALWKTSLVIR